jgi:hypothetical protein
MPAASKPRNVSREAIDLGARTDMPAIVSRETFGLNHP